MDIPTVKAEEKSPTLKESLLSLPMLVFEGANRYDTDDKHVLSLWFGGRTWDIEVPKDGLA